MSPRSKIIIASIVGVLAIAPFASPSLQAYRRRAKASEASEMLDLLKKGAASYYTTPRTNARGAPVDCQFPADVPWTPTGTSCCDPQVDKDGDGQCDADPEAWNHPTWKAMNFAIAGEHLCQYAVEQSSGVKSLATTVLKARCDFGCDGNARTFEVTIRGDPNATSGHCDQVGTAGGGCRNADGDTE